MLYLNIANAVLCKTEALLQTGHLPSQVRHIEDCLKPSGASLPNQVRQ